jgi:hypothetical protein
MYILRQERYAEHDDLVRFGFGNFTPSDRMSITDFWFLADSFEPAGSTIYREFEVNIPEELNHEQGHELIESFIAKEIPNQPYTYAIHEKNGRQHCHLMFSERSFDGIKRDPATFFKKYNRYHPDQGGAKKNPYFHSKEALLHFRKSWEQEQNRILQKYGHTARVDCRSLYERRKEAVAQGDMEKVAELDREAVNVDGNIYAKVKFKGIESLTTTERDQWDRYLTASEAKKRKEKGRNITPKQITPQLDLSSTQIKDRISEIDAKDYDKIALGVLSHKKYQTATANLKRLKIDFGHLDVFEAKRQEYESQIKEIEAFRGTGKYNQLVFFLKRENETEKKRLQSILHTKFGIDPAHFSATSEDEAATKAARQKIFASYDAYTPEKIRMEYRSLLYRNPKEEATYRVTQYRNETLISNLLALESDLVSCQKSILSTKDTTQKEKLAADISAINSKMLFITQENIRLSDTISSLRPEIEKETQNRQTDIAMRLAIAQEILTQKNLAPEPRTPEEIIQDYIMCRYELHTKNKLYSYFAQKNQTEGYSRPLYLLRSEIQFLQADYKKVQASFRNLSPETSNKIIFARERTVHQELKSIRREIKDLSIGPKSASTEKDLLTLQKKARELSTLANIYHDIIVRKAEPKINRRLDMIHKSHADPEKLYFKMAGALDFTGEKKDKSLEINYHEYDGYDPGM